MISAHKKSPLERELRDDELQPEELKCILMCHETTNGYGALRNGANVNE